MLAALWNNVDYVAAAVLFCIGFYVIIAKNNLIKKILGLNIMEVAVLSFLIALGMVDGGGAPVMGVDARAPFASPLPQALVLTGIVVSVSKTALALSLVIRIYRQCGTIEADELREME